MRRGALTVLAGGASFLLTIAALLVVTAWSFAWADLALVGVFVIGVGVGVWMRGAWSGRS